MRTRAREAPPGTEDRSVGQKETECEVGSQKVWLANGCEIERETKRFGVCIAEHHSAYQRPFKQIIRCYQEIIATQTRFEETV